MVEGTFYCSMGILVGNWNRNTGILGVRCHPCLPSKTNELSFGLIHGASGMRFFDVGCDGLMEYLVPFCKILVDF